MENYKETLDKEAHRRYLEKISDIGDVDPYQIEKSKWSRDHALFPNVTYLGLVNYLIFHPSPYCTIKDFQNYKSLEAYDRFVCGWVRDVAVHVYKAGDKT